jgi:serine/threonine-protein kinase
MAEPPREPPRDPADDETIVLDEWGPEPEPEGAGATRVVQEEVREEPPRRRLPEIWPWLLAFLLAVVGIVAAVLLLSGDDEDAAPTTTSARVVSVPDVIGDDESEARSALEAAGFEVTAASVPSDAPEGTVVAQDPGAGEDAPEGSSVRINLAEEAPETAPATTEAPPATTAEPPPTTTEAPPPAPAPAPATVPDVVGQVLADAAESFGAEGLRVSVVYVPSEEPLGTVVAQAQGGGTKLQAGDTVQLNVSPGRPGPPARVPDVVGQDEGDARTALEDARLEVLAIEVEGEDTDDVLAQTPSGGARVPRGSLVVIYTGTDD